MKSSKIVDLDPEKRAMKLALEDFIKNLQEIDSSLIKGAMFYIDSELSSIAANVSVFNPSWTMTGRVRTFMQELELENYLYDFDDGLPEDEEI